MISQPTTGRLPMRLGQGGDQQLGDFSWALEVRQVPGPRQLDQACVRHDVAEVSGDLEEAVHVVATADHKRGSLDLRRIDGYLLGLRRLSRAVGGELDLNSVPLCLAYQLARLSRRIPAQPRPHIELGRTRDVTGFEEPIFL